METLDQEYENLITGEEVNLPVHLLFDRIASLRPDLPFVSLPCSNKNNDDDDLHHGYQDYTYQDIAKAVDRCATWLVETLGGTENCGPLAWVGPPQDLRCVLLILACAKTQNLLLTILPLINPEGLTHLIRATGCKRLLHSEPRLPIVDEVTKTDVLETIQVPELYDWLNGEVTTVPCPNTSLIETQDKVFWITHSSGTTGLYKPISFTHRMFTSYYAPFSRIPRAGRQRMVHWQFHKQRVLVAVPIGIVYGMLQVLGINLVYPYTVVLPQSSGATTPAAFIDAAHVHGNVRGTIITTRTIAQLASDSAYLANLEQLDTIAFGGGPLPQHLLTKLAQRTRLLVLYGSTETGQHPAEITEADEVGYIRFHKRLPHEMRHVCHGIHELVLLRGDDGLFQGVFSRWPHLNEYKMGDFFEPHATMKDSWLYRGRAEDLIYTTGGEVFLPTIMEQVIEAHPFVDVALIYDRGPAGLCLILQAKQGLGVEDRPDEFMERIWPVIQSVNDICPVAARISRGLVLSIDSTIQIPRGMKTYPQRAKVLQIFAAKLDELYVKHNQSQGVVEEVYNAPLDAEEIHKAPLDTDDVSKAPLDTKQFSSASFDIKEVHKAPLDTENTLEAPLDTKEVLKAPLDTENISEVLINIEEVYNAPNSIEEVSGAPHKTEDVHKPSVDLQEVHNAPLDEKGCKAPLNARKVYEILLNAEEVYKAPFDAEKVYKILLEAEGVYKTPSRY